jgi:hypothetical protein
MAACTPLLQKSACNKKMSAELNRTFSLNDENVTVEGKHLAPGDYKCEWSGSGPDVKVNILKGKETVASVSARIVSQGAANEQDGYALTPAQDGSQSLTQIFFAGEKYDLEIGQAPSADTNQAPNPSGSN